MMEQEEADISALEGSRFPAWTALTIFSAVALAAHVVEGDSGNDAAHKWVTSVCAISMSIGCCAMISHFVATMNFSGTPTEAGVAFFIVIFWAAGLPVIMNPNNRIAVGALFGIINANLYFFSWAAFITNLYILAEMAKATNAVDVYETKPKTAKWYLLFAASVILLGSSARYFGIFECKSNSGSTCRRTSYAISLGSISTVLAMVLSIMSSKCVPVIMAEVVVSFIIFAMYAFGVGFITFGSGPGRVMGNLYFSTWGGFIVSMLLFAQCFKELSYEEPTDVSDVRSGPPPPTKAPPGVVLDQMDDDDEL